MIIRDAIAADLPHIVEIYNAAIRERHATADTTPITVSSRIAWLREHDATRHPLWVVVDNEARARDGRPKGWLSFQPFYGRPACEATAEISVYVDPLSRRAGIGRTLLARAIRASPALGLHSLLGFIFGHNDASLALFTGFGFERWGLLPRVAELDGVERDLVIMGLRVG